MYKQRPAGRQIVSPHGDRLSFSGARHRTATGCQLFATAYRLPATNYQLSEHIGGAALALARQEPERRFLEKRLMEL
jgi:hypothetical protein